MSILLIVSPSSSSSSSAFLSCIKPLKTLSSFTYKPLLALKNKAISVTSPHSTTSNPSQPPELQTFWQWLCDQGVVSTKSPVRPATVPEGLGLVAQRDIGKNEVVLEIPKKFWINPDAVAASEIGNVCSGLKPWISVALFLIREKKREDSLWRVYLDILPESTDSTVFWSEEELVELQGTQLLSTTIDVKEYIRNEFLKLEEEILLPRKELFPYPITFDDFLWAFGMIRSRAFSRFGGQNLVVVPLADLINHSQTITTEGYAEIKGTGPFSRNLLFSLWSSVAVKAGEQVFIQYDLDKSNAKLALDYGFVESKSDRNAYTLTLEIPESDPFFEDKLDIAESIGLSETTYFDIVLGRPLPPMMFPYLRLVALGGPDAFLFDLSFRSTILGQLDSPISHANEELICRMVRDVCRTALSGYHTTIEEDEKLEGGNLDPRLRIAIGVRAGEKRVLQQIDGIFKERELKLNELEYYQDQRPQQQSSLRIETRA
ncbi:hypothetical protein Ddye_030945 [Dipteronia dyeriana]|uniref:[fructose-bisphosphate aldolase]-lysine N-methyltransferase n=1 Tax=Dipteronia dyeriana TaxID=168575 RepID=A0AAD9WN69_9ROSI|nr:hypothetical protein Ddye_030945 [Dipteronia dyeriana]